MKKIIKNTAMSIGISLAIFCIIGIIVDVTNHGNFTLTDYSFSKMVIGTLLVGVGFGVPAIVYDKEHLPFPIQTVIHMGTGCIIYTIIAFFVGWIPTELGIGTCVAIVFCELTVSFLIWFCFQQHHKKMARKMNERIQQIREQ